MSEPVEKRPRNTLWWIMLIIVLTYAGGALNGYQLGHANAMREVMKALVDAGLARPHAAPTLSPEQAEEKQK